MAQVKKFKVVLKSENDVELLSRTLDIPISPFADVDAPQERLIELLSRDFYTPVLAHKPTETTLTYIDSDDGSENAFRYGQMAVYPDSSRTNGIGASVMLAIVNGKAVWREVVEREPKPLPTEIRLDYPKRVTFGSDGENRIRVTLLPEGADQNVLFLADNKACQVFPDGYIYPVNIGHTTVHVVPVANTSLYRSLVIDVIGERIRLVSESSVRFTTAGEMRLL